MVTFIILINTERNMVNKVAEALIEVERISEVYSVSGHYDLIAIVRAKSNEEIAELITEKLHRIDGIKQTETMLALRAFSGHDMESMFFL